MRTSVYHNNNDVRLEQRPVPNIGAGELLVKVMASGICGSDVMEWYRIPKAPLVLGHEIAGEIAKVGEGVHSFKVGGRVFVSHHVPCMACHYCQSGNYTVCDTLRSTNFDPGGFSEYLRVPQINVRSGTFALPDEVSYEEGTIVEPLACVVRGQEKARFRPGQSVLVLGSGISGILHIQLARASGAKRIFATDISEYRLQAAMRFGADAAFLADHDVPGRMRDLNDGYLADLVIVCVGAPQAISQALKSVERGGTILFFAPMLPGQTFPMPIYDLWRDGITTTVSYAGSPADIDKAIELIRSRAINAKGMITHRLGLAETGRGFQLVAQAQNSLKVVIEPQR
ncbi:MAG: zinc-dependent dehydrogenase [Dehalococcoidia bacterium]|nr:zinc-dependent dehydrogenase [Dehalococcoidia bacterium]